jgi:hypothetical protein
MIAKLRNFGAIISEENGRGQMLTYQYKGWLDLRIEERNQEV